MAIKMSDVENFSLLTIPVLGLQVDYLSEHSHFVADVVGWLHSEWGYLYPNRSKDDVRGIVKNQLGIDELPITLIAYKNAKAVGTVSLRKTELENEEENIFPWLSSLYVDEAFRHNGVGQLLVDACVLLSKALGYSCLYLFTDKIFLKNWYLGLGWYSYKEAMHHRSKVNVLRYDI